MKILIKAVIDKGNYAKEHVIFEVIEDCNIGRYILFNTSSEKVIQSFWFPDKHVKAGDLIYLYTKALNKDNEFVLLQEESAIHLFYWDLGQAVWNIEKDCIALIEARDWRLQKISSKVA